MSVDVFHQEKIPLEPVYEFAKRVKVGQQINIKLQPAWLINKNNDNPWNYKTKQILEQFDDLGIAISNGNNIFPTGNAVKFLPKYFPNRGDISLGCGDEAYSTKLDEVNSISIAPNGDVYVCCFAIVNVYKEDVSTILNRYNPKEIPMMKILLEDGIKGFKEYANAKGIIIEEAKHYSTCSLCREIVSNLF